MVTFLGLLRFCYFHMNYVLEWEETNLAHDFWDWNAVSLMQIKNKNTYKYTYSVALQLWSLLYVLWRTRLVWIYLKIYFILHDQFDHLKVHSLILAPSLLTTPNILQLTVHVSKANTVHSCISWDSSKYYYFHQNDFSVIIFHVVYIIKLW